MRAKQFCALTMWSDGYYLTPAESWAKIWPVRYIYALSGATFRS